MIARGWRGSKQGEFFSCAPARHLIGTFSWLSQSKLCATRIQFSTCLWQAVLPWNSWATFPQDELRSGMNLLQTAGFEVTSNTHPHPPPLPVLTSPHPQLSPQQDLRADLVCNPLYQPWGVWDLDKHALLRSELLHSLFYLKRKYREVPYLVIWVPCVLFSVPIVWK